MRMEKETLVDSFEEADQLLKTTLKLKKILDKIGIDTYKSCQVREIPRVAREFNELNRAWRLLTAKREGMTEDMRNQVLVAEWHMTRILAFERRNHATRWIVTLLKDLADELISGEGNLNVLYIIY